jgi:hypothetical protein
METIPAVPTRRTMVMENRRTTLLTEVQSSRRPMRVVKARSRYGMRARHRPVWQIHQHQVLKQMARVRSFQTDRKRKVHYMQVMERQNTLIMEELTFQMVQNTLIMEELIVQMVHHGYMQGMEKQNKLIMEELIVQMVRHGRKRKVHYVLIMEKQILR